MIQKLSEKSLVTFQKSSENSQIFNLSLTEIGRKLGEKLLIEMPNTAEHVGGLLDGGTTEGSDEING